MRAQTEIFDTIYQQLEKGLVVTLICRAYFYPHIRLYH